MEIWCRWVAPNLFAIVDSQDMAKFKEVGNHIWDKQGDSGWK